MALCPEPINWVFSIVYIWLKLLIGEVKQKEINDIIIINFYYIVVYKMISYILLKELYSYTEIWNSIEKNQTDKIFMKHIQTLQTPLDTLSTCPKQGTYNPVDVVLMFKSCLFFIEYLFGQ